MKDEEELKDKIEEIEEAVVEIIKAPVKIPLKIIEDLFNWFDE